MGVGAAICHPSGCSVQHIFDEYAITRGGVVDQDMGYCPDELAVLDDGTARHVCVKYRTKFFAIFFDNPRDFIQNTVIFTPGLI